MLLPQNLQYFLLYSLSIISLSVFISAESEDNDKQNSSAITDPNSLSFIQSRMEHLSAVKRLKQMENAVKQHQLLVDILKQLSKVLGESRKLLVVSGDPTTWSHLSEKDPGFAEVVDFLENTAFFCDLLVFFPELTLKLLQKNLLWRVNLIDSVQDAVTSNVKFVDKNTVSQFEKALQILSKGSAPFEIKHAQKTEDRKKTKRKARVAQSEL